MLQWLPILLLCAAVSGIELECDHVNYKTDCWNSHYDRYFDCWHCVLRYRQIFESDKELAIHAQLENGTVVDAGLVFFYGGHVSRMPKLIHKTTNQQIMRAHLYQTSTRVLNAQFFGNACANLIFFRSDGNYNVSVEADAFQNCAKLEALELYNSKISSIPADTFLGLYKLIQLDLSINQLTQLNENWFKHLHNLEALYLGHNQLEAIPETSFDKLRKLENLHLYGNKIKVVTKRMFQNNEQLQVIILESNQIKVIESATFKHLNQLIILDLRENKCINKYFSEKQADEIAAALNVCNKATSVVPVLTAEKCILMFLSLLLFKLNSRTEISP